MSEILKPIKRSNIRLKLGRFYYGMLRKILWVRMYRMFASDYQQESLPYLYFSHRTVLLRKLKDGNGQYIWQPALQSGEPDRLLGFEVLTSAYVPTIEVGASVIAFGDFSYYNIGDRGVRSFAELKELFAGNGMIGFVAKERVDGKLVLPEAVKILKIKD